MSKLRQSARGQDCTLNIIGICNYDPSTTVLAHLPDGTNGMGKKAGKDENGCFACSSCHDAVDSRIQCLFGIYNHCECPICEYKRNKADYIEKAQAATKEIWKTEA